MSEFFLQPPPKIVVSDFAAAKNDPAACDSFMLLLYTEGSYREINRALRERRGGSCIKFAKAVERALKSFPHPKSASLWRGTARFAQLDQLKIGECLVDLAFLSTSQDEAIGREFATKHIDGVLWRISATNGRDISTRSQYPREQEVLLLPGTPLKLRSRTGDQLQILDFVEATPSECESRWETGPRNSPENTHN